MVWNRIISFSVIAGALSSCAVEGLEPYCQPEGFVNVSSFETQFTTLNFEAGHDLHFEVTANPQQKGLNRSEYCGMVISAGNPYESIRSEELTRKIDFTAHPPVFKVKVLGPRKGAKIYMKLIGDGTNPDIEVQDVCTTVAGEWEELTFDFSSFCPESNVYRKIELFFDAAVADRVGDKWYFDDIMVPDDDLTQISLFQRYPGNPIFKPTEEQGWMCCHVANAAILSPSNSPDGKWWLFIRGSGNTPAYHDQIGIFTQEPSDFKPYGPWDERPDNPVMHYGEPGEYDEWHLLDCAPVVGKDNVIYFYYLGRTFAGGCATGVRYSVDGGKTFVKPEGGRPFNDNSGSCDAVYKDGRYYVITDVGRAFETIDPLSSQGANVRKFISKGGGPSNFDSHSIHGLMIFRLEGIDKWFMSYQGSAINIDFPDRFHVAMSDDFEHWEKVENSQPLFTRGSRGQWDQGGIWYPEIFEHGDSLYLYYEGWGREGYVANRNRPYFYGRSCTGAASCSKGDFLKWCGIGE
ncbi:MAG: hypothetical protein NC308_06205 [Clostridium sp.]|nr:hypothetical protein [Bacteroides sp.]MCM1198463.1 hypothetical protein [Clostridium sp.]